MEAHAGIELEPGYPVMYSPLGLGLAGLGRYDEAVEAFRHAAPGDPMPQSWLGWGLGSPGRGRKPSRSSMTLRGDEAKGMSVVLCWPRSAWGWATMIKPSHGSNTGPKSATL